MRTVILMMSSMLFAAGCTPGSNAVHEAQLEKRLASLKRESCQSPTYTVTRTPGEWEPVAAMMMSTQTYEPIRGEPMQDVQTQQAAGFLQHGIEVDLLANSEDEGDAFEDALAALGVSNHDMHGFKPYVTPLDPVLEMNHTDVWSQDNGSIYAYASAPGQPNALAVIDGHFQGWSYGPISDQASRDLYAVDDTVSGANADFFGYPRIETDLPMEGGSFFSNGVGTVMYSLISLQRGLPDWTQAEIEAELERVTGATHVIAVPYINVGDEMAYVDPYNLWTMPDGNLVYQGFGVAHADQFYTFLDAHTIAYPWIDPADATNEFEDRAAEIEQDLEDFLATQVDQDGNPFTLVRFPEPGLETQIGTPSTQGLFTDGDEIADILSGTVDGSSSQGLTAPFSIVESNSYMNYSVAWSGNKHDRCVVEVPAQWHEGAPDRLQDTDLEAQEDLADAFPGCDILPIDPSKEGIDGGELHCTARQRPPAPKKHH